MLHVEGGGKPPRSVFWVDRGRPLARALSALSLFLLLMALAMPVISVRAQTLDEAEPSETVPPNVETLQKLLAEPDVQAWLRAHAIASEPKHAASEPKTEHSAPPSHRFA